MRKHFRLGGLAALFVGLAVTSQAVALRIVPVTVEETPVPGTDFTEYTLINDTNSQAIPFNFTIFASSTTGNTPSTTDTGWNAVALDATLWAEPITTGVPSWQQYTGLSYTQAFPSDPASVNGYFLNLAFDSSTGNTTFFGTPIAPGTNLTEFYFVGPPGSQFVVAGPTTAGSPEPLSNFQTFTGSTIDLPEPTCLALFGGMTLLGLKRPRRS